ncbi:hypothetical protein FE393_11770 [Xenorhabdus sp. psl]|nr:hypothetical protein [Xenorhabdus sp. psl]
MAKWSARQQKNRSFDWSRLSLNGCLIEAEQAITLSLLTHAVLAVLRTLSVLVVDLAKLI